MASAAAPAPSSAFAPVRRRTLADDLAQRIQDLIDAEPYGPDDRLPTIAEMARRFGVGPPTVREALKKLETLGAVVIKHGSGVYVGARPNPLFVSNPVLAGTPSKKTLLDLIEARLPVEVEAVALAARHATDDDLAEMTALLDRAERQLGEGDALNQINMSFHASIAKASGNSVLHQIMDVLVSAFQDEQRAILYIFGSERQDHDEHVGLLEALRARDEDLAVARMRAHLEGVRAVLLRWDETTPPTS